jgi:hypothetical protein
MNKRNGRWRRKVIGEQQAGEQFVKAIKRVGLWIGVMADFAGGEGGGA